MTSKQPEIPMTNEKRLEQIKALIDKKDKKSIIERLRLEREYLDNGGKLEDIHNLSK